MSAPVDHAPPWRWRDDGQLVDATGRVVLGAQGDRGIFAYVASGYVGEQLLAAPEMEALLRDLVASQSIVMDGEADEQRQHRFDGLRRAIFGAGPLLQRLDAARKAGG